jgi:allantoin racemase
MRILVVNPNTTDSMTRDIEAPARRGALSTTEIVAVTAPWGPRSIEGHFEETLAATATVEAIAAHQDGADAVVLACYGDPGLYAARELVDVPVVGIASVRSSGLSVLDIGADTERAGEVILQEARLAVEMDGAEAIALGCAGMGPTGRLAAGAAAGCTGDRRGHRGREALRGAARLRLDDQQGRRLQAPGAERDRRRGPGSADRGAAARRSRPPHQSDLTRLSRQRTDHANPHPEWTHRYRCR